MKSITKKIAEKIPKWEKSDFKDGQYDIFLSDYLYLPNHPNTRFLVIRYLNRVDVQLELINEENARYILFLNNKKARLILNEILEYLSHA